MIMYFAPGGRLGNQLFALCYLESIRSPSERVVSTGLGAALQCLSGMHRYLNADHPVVVRLVKKVVEPNLMILLSRLRIVSSNFERADGSVRRMRGILPVTYVMGYYQEAKLPEKTGVPFKLRRRLIVDARESLGEAVGRTPLFVHVRRTDYINYRIGNEIDPSLPLSYYREALRLLRASVPDPFFFFLGDEPEWVAREFQDLPQSRIKTRPPAVDIALMSLCAGGVVSNSTFAWWGAFLCARSSPVLAPRFWLGWRSSFWYPPGIQARRFRYIDVE